jgi:sugar O-acyltransferase (sialic acid O-acetyltransferase NeuD family)
MFKPPRGSGDVVVFGTGLFAECVKYLLDNDSDHRVVAFSAHRAHITAPEFMGLPVVPFEEVTERHPPSRCQMFVAVGYRKLNRLRASVYAEAKAKGYTLISYVSSKTTWWGAALGDNCFIFEDNTIQPFVRIGNDVVLWSGNHIGHHGTIGDHVFISSHVVISGQVSIGPYSFLGVNATLRDAITVGADSLIGAGAIVMKSVPDRGVLIPRRTELDARTSDALDF